MSSGSGVSVGAPVVLRLQVYPRQPLGLRVCEYIVFVSLLCFCVRLRVCISMCLAVSSFAVALWGGFPGVAAATFLSKELCVCRWAAFALNGRNACRNMFSLRFGDTAVQAFTSAATGPSWGGITSIVSSKGHFECRNVRRLRSVPGRHVQLHAKYDDSRAVWHGARETRIAGLRHRRDANRAGVRE
jgi:hypothetical protein